MHSHPCPATGKTTGACPGFVVDHKQALKHGGRDDPSNMQWQTTAEAKAKGPRMNKSIRKSSSGIDSAMRM